MPLHWIAILSKLSHRDSTSGYCIEHSVLLADLLQAITMPGQGFHVVFPLSPFASAPTTPAERGCVVSDRGPQQAIQNLSSSWRYEYIDAGNALHVESGSPSASPSQTPSFRARLHLKLSPLMDRWIPRRPIIVSLRPTPIIIKRGSGLLMSFHCFVSSRSEV